MLFHLNFRFCEAFWWFMSFSGRKGKFLRILLFIVIFFIGLILGYVVRRSVHEVMWSHGKKCPYQEGYEVGPWFMFNTPRGKRFRYHMYCWAIYIPWSFYILWSHLSDIARFAQYFPTDTYIISWHLWSNWSRNIPLHLQATSLDWCVFVFWMSVIRRNTFFM